MRYQPFNALPAHYEPKWILDIGANCGTVAAAALQSFPQVQVICVEPVASVFEELTKNLSAAAGRVHTLNCAISNKNGTGDILLNTFSPASSLNPQAELHKISNPSVRETGDRQAVTLLTLETLRAALPSPMIDVVKIDVEGHEISVLEGGPSFFRECVEFVIIEISMHRDDAYTNQAVFKIFELMKSYGYYLFNIFDIYPDTKNDLMIAQMDCVFRNTRKLQN